jgi:hypothetical protein
MFERKELSVFQNIIYVDGALADSIGSLGLQSLADAAAKIALQPVSVLTQGPSKYHSQRRYNATPPEPKP